MRVIKKFRIPLFVCISNRPDPRAFLLARGVPKAFGLTAGG
jgi:hypothetical protein